MNLLKITIALVAVVLSTLNPVGPAWAAGDPVVHRDLMVMTSDSIRLSTDLYLPAEKGPFPVILIRTAYGKSNNARFAQFFVSKGYAVVIQDVRGKWGSEGDMVPFVSEQKDGLETLNWITSQVWCNGSVGMWGASYLAHCALAVAAANPPALKTVFNMSGWLNGDKINNPGGALHWMLILTWMLHEATQKYRDLGSYEIDDLFRYIPLKDAMASVGIDDPVFSNPDTLDAARYDYKDIQIPIFHITGLYDFVSPSALTVFREVSAHTDRYQKLMVGPWVHDQVWSTYTKVGDTDFGRKMAMGFKRINQLALRWFDHWLKGKESGITAERPVEVFIMGQNEWMEFDHWPPAGTFIQEWYLGSGGNANTASGDGVLSMNLSKQAEAADQFLFDPMNPVPTLGGANFHFFPEKLGIRDQRQIEQRPDVLVYTSEPLEQDLLICGDIEVVLFASTEARDTDFTAKLVEVRPDGYAGNVVEGIIRASMRNSLTDPELLEPGEIYELRLDLGAAANRIKAGHRLRVEISSSNFPKYDRNPNTGEHPWEATRYIKTSQTIYHDRNHPSRIVLPVLSTTGTER
jgi:putative CocE/NonD family hydrolase